MPRAAVLGLLPLVLMLVVPAFTAGYAAVAKVPGPETVDSARVLVSHGSHPAIRPAVSQDLSQSPSPSSQNSSWNWSGYVISSTTGSVTDVNGSWIVPSAFCSPRNSYSASWVGIDGWTDSTVEQTGTHSDCLNGIATYYAWYEFYPSAPVQISNIAVSSGDVISAGVSCQTVGLECTASITDVGSGQSFSYSQTYRPESAPQISSADWIAEAPALLLLPSLGPVYSGQDLTGISPSDSATVNDTSGPIGSFGAAVVEITMVSPDGSTLAQPSGLSHDGTSFSVTWSTSGPLIVSCDPAPVVVGSATSCKATVLGSGPVPTGIVAWSSNSSGKFSRPICKLSKEACSVRFTPTAAGSFVILTASYGGDSENFPFTGTYGLAVAMKATDTTASCTPKSVVAGSSTIITCEAKVTGYSPTGTVTWSQSGTGSVFLNSTLCALSQGTCRVTATGSTGGQVIMNATYAGDSSNRVSSRTAALTVKKISTAVTTSCAQSSIGVEENVTCTATVLGGYPSHNGTVTWSEASGKGKVNFSSTSCVLTSGSCSVTVTATAAGSVKIKAAYGGDSSDLESSGSFVLAIS